MLINDFFIPLAIFTTALYITSTLIFTLKIKKTKLEANSTQLVVKKNIDGMRKKVDDISDVLNVTISPILENVASQVKNIHCDFDKDIILQKLNENGYSNAQLNHDNKISAMITWDIGNDECPEIIEIRHLLTIDQEQSSILIESLCLALEGDIEKNVYKEILELNFSLKKSDFSILPANEKTSLIFAQDHIKYPRGTFHIYQLKESLDDLEYAFASLRELFVKKEISFIDITSNYLLNIKK